MEGGNPLREKHTMAIEFEHVAHHHIGDDIVVDVTIQIAEQRTKKGTRLYTVVGSVKVMSLPILGGVSMTSKSEDAVPALYTLGRARKTAQVFAPEFIAMAEAKQEEVRALADQTIRGIIHQWVLHMTQGHFDGNVHVIPVDDLPGSDLVQ